MLVAVDGKDTRSVTNALTRQIRQLPQQLRSSLTWDRGMEMAEHTRFTVATDVQVYFCDPQSPWQRGSNEAAKLNTRPRQTLDFKTPAATLDAALR